MPLFNIKKPSKAKEKQKGKEESPKNENLYTNIFEKKEEKKKDDSKVLSGVFAKEKEKKKPKENILGPLPELEKNLIGSFDPSKRNLHILKIITGSLLGALLLAFSFFYAELTLSFDLLSGIRGPNTAQQLNNTENSIITTQTSINQKNYLLLSYYLQKLSYLSDGYAKIRDEENTAAIQAVQNDIILTYENASVKWEESIAAGGIPRDTFVVQLRKEFQNELKQLRKETPGAAVNAEIKNYSAALAILNNNQLKKVFTHNTDDIRSDLPRDDSKLFALTQNVLGTLANDFSTISEIKMNRIKWSIIVQEIERVTKSIDTLYNTGFFEELGGISYSNFDFDSTTNRIILSGQAKRDDGTTFTLIVNLIDALENSPVFTNVDNRSYPKTGDEDKGYLSSFRIELSLAKDYVLTN